MKHGIVMCLIALAVAGTSVVPALADLYAYRDQQTRGLVLTNRKPPDGAAIVLQRPEGTPRDRTLTAPAGPMSLPPPVARQGTRLEFGPQTSYDLGHYKYVQGIVRNASRTNPLHSVRIIARFYTPDGALLTIQSAYVTPVTLSPFQEGIYTVRSPRPGVGQIGRYELYADWPAE